MNNVRKMIQNIDTSLWRCKYRLYTRIFGLPPRPFTQKLSDLFKDKSMHGAEIGVYRGENAISMLRNLNIDKLYLIDPWCSYETYTDNYGDEVLRDVYETAKRNLKNYNESIKFVRKYSSEAITDVPNGMDFVYIDGNHKYEFVKKDIELYYEKIRFGGLIGGHDIGNGSCGEHDGVVRAVSEFAVKNDLQLHIDQPDWWMIKI